MLLMKRFAFTFLFCNGVLFSAIAQNVAAMKIDTTWIKKEISEAKAITSKELTAYKWVTHSGWIQWYDHYSENGPYYEEIKELGYVYSFFKDGTYTVDAVIPNGGTWTYNEKTKRLIMVSKFRRSLDMDSFIVLKGDVLVWYNWDESGIYATKLKRK